MSPRSFALVLPVALAGCVTVEAPGPTSPQSAGPVCKAEVVQDRIGQPATAELGAELLRLSGARSLRWGPPDSMWTMDFRPDRLNVRYDRAMRITEISCG